MADSTTTPILSVCATISDNVKNLVIKNGQLIFVQDAGRIALDYNNKRTFYNQIIELESDAERVSLLAPIAGKYYFVIETAVLWRYDTGWKQLTFPPEEIVFIGTEMPELGKKNKIYIDTSDGNEHVAVWDENKDEYHIVANRIYSLTPEEVKEMFLN